MSYTKPPSYILGSHPNSRVISRRGNYVARCVDPMCVLEVRLFKQETNALAEGEVTEGFSCVGYTPVPKLDAQGNLKGTVKGYLRIDLCQQTLPIDKDGVPRDNLARNAYHFVRSLLSAATVSLPFVDEP